MTCPYCGLRADTHVFLTEGQLKYIEAFCELVERAVQSANDGEHVIDMDQVVDAVGKGGVKPKFYYAEESQQNKYKCLACDESNDILGRYGYCSSCGTHNGLREKEWERKLFHNLQPCAEALSAVFDINTFKNLRQEDIDFAILMFHRRHVYEHNGGEVDEKYIRDSGDTSVRVKQVIRETREAAVRIADVVLQIGRNIHEGFHSIFPPEEMPVRIQQEHLKRRRQTPTS
jgi:hypothetical protein